MRFLVIIFCISGFLAKDVARVSWEIWFKVNQEQIIAEKCENKAIPMMHCNGKCYLAKQLKKLEVKEQDHNSKSNPFGQPLKADWISSTDQMPVVQFIFSEKQQTYTTLSIVQTRDYQGLIFHPPAA